LLDEDPPEEQRKSGRTFNVAVPHTRLIGESGIGLGIHEPAAGRVTEDRPDILSLWVLLRPRHNREPATSGLKCLVTAAEHGKSDGADGGAASR
jgi:hypothetical protein